MDHLLDTLGPWLGTLRAHEARLTRRLAGTDRALTLDLGSGDGQVASAALGDAVALDANVHALLTASLRSRVAADAAQLPFPDGAFSTVTAISALEHMTRPGSTVREVARVLRPGGRFVALVPSSAFRAPVGTVARICGTGVWHAYNELHEHRNLLSAGEWRAELTGAGLELDDVVAYGGRTFAAQFVAHDLLATLPKLPGTFRMPHQMARLVGAAVASLPGPPADPSEPGPWLAMSARRESL